MYEELLTKVPLFRELSKRELKSVGECCRERDYAAGDLLLRQGEGGVGLFLLVSGGVRIVQRRDDGSEHELRRLGAGDAMGEMGLLDEQPRSASAIALEPTRALVIPVWDFRATLREVPDVAIKLLGVLSQRLRQAEQRELINK
jgi:CRP-like cAMP-binding protein